MKFSIVDRCPAPRSVAPYIYLVLRRAGQGASSIYRGSDAAALLHSLGLRTQAEIHRDLPTISNPEGESQHDLHSDGNGNPGPVGRRLEEWEQGVDSGGNDSKSKEDIEAAGAHYGWSTRHPYSRGVEGHHWCFAEKPKARGLKQKALVARTRLVMLFTNQPPLKLGSRGPRAQILKRHLVTLGYMDKYVRGPLQAPTVAAIKKFQRDHGLTADGIAGPATRVALSAEVKRHKKHKPPRKRQRATTASPQAIALIKEFEGFRAKPYQDSVGVWTIGYGETRGVSRNSRPVTEHEAAKDLAARVKRDYAPAVAKVGVPLNQNQFDALTSFAYNLGGGMLGPDHTIGQELRAKRYARAADAILLYDKAGGKALAGLTRRRRAERALFLKPTKGGK